MSWLSQGGDPNGIPIDALQGSDFRGSGAPILRMQPSLLVLASWLGCLGVVTQLLDFGCSVNFKCADHNTPLTLCCITGHLDVAEVLILRGADIDAKSTWA